MSCLTFCPGEESMESEPTASGPLPHFSVLKEEMSDNQFRVQQFLKGAFTYKVEERYTDKTVGDVLVCFINLKSWEIL